MITVHHLSASQSDRVVWLCEELGLEYELCRYERDPESRLAPAAYRRLHPAGTAPVIEDDGIVLGESAAIVEYLLARYGKGALTVPSEAANYPDYAYWFHFANGSMMPSVMLPLIATMSGGEVGMLEDRLVRNYAMVERRLTEVPWLAGPDFTAADLMMTFPFSTMRLFSPRDLAEYPAIRAWLQRISVRPAFHKMIVVADPDLHIPLV